jgi:protein O-GlcNAc transferase
VDPALQRALDDARAGKLPHAIASIRRILAVKPANLDALQVLALLLSQSGQLDQAAAQLSRAVDLSPAAPHLRNNYANILIQLRRYSEAAAQARKAIELNAGYIPAYIALSCAQLYLPDSEAAIDAARRGLAVGPNPELSKNLVLALDQSGRADQALHAAEQAHFAHPTHAALHSLYLMLLNYTDRPRGATDIAAAHRRFGELHPSAKATPINTEPDRPIRIGIVSADLRTHSVAYFLEPILQYAPSDIDITCFSLSDTPSDPTTRRLRGYVKSWDEVGHLDDAGLAAKIRERRIDILLDLMGHTGGNRLAALASKPAPVIVTAIGYPNTTGLGAIDYRLVDSVTDPAGAEALATERLLHVDPCFLCYRPPHDAPETAMPAPDAPITFGSFNTPAKVSPRTAALWAGALNAIPGSRLLLKSKDLGEACSRAAVLERLARAGIVSNRITILPAAASVRDHLTLYSQVHIALDTVPYNGTTTTCEALYMGVPVITLQGEVHASRVGMSLLSAAGHPEWVASSPDHFGRIAAALAADSSGLAKLRAGLRRSVQASSLCNAAGYSTRMFASLRECWRSFCGEANA